MITNLSDTLAALSEADYGRAEAIVNSDPVISQYTACDWDDLNDDGKTWIAAIVRQAIAAHSQEIAEWLVSNPIIPFRHGPAVTHEAYRRDIAAAILNRAGEPS